MRPYVLHEFPVATLPSGEPVSDIHHDGSNILPAGTIVSLVLESRDKHKASKWFTCHYPVVEIQDESLIQNLPAQTRSEELFFRIVEYLPRPRDRYVVQRIYTSPYIYAPLVDTHVASPNHGREDGSGTEISIQLVTAELRNRYFPLDEDVLWQARSCVIKAHRELRKGKISQEQFQDRHAQAKKEYADIRDNLRAERDAKYPIGSTAKLRIEPAEETVLHKTSAFLQGGDQITCKRKNIHHVGEPGTCVQVCQPTDSPRAWCVTTWNGTLLDTSVRQLVTRGHLVRAVCMFHFSDGPFQTVKYFSIVDVLPDGTLLGVLRAYYCDSFWEEEMLDLIGKYFIIHRDAISEIPHTWPGNESLERPVEAAKQEGALAVTGIFAADDQGAT